MRDRGWVERTEAVEIEDGKASIHCASEVHWGGVVARKECVQKIAAVGSVEMFARASAGRFLARTMCDPLRA